ncbi:MAG: metallophosphoesterase family protein [Deltaproteobacteria bacterium]|nr:metallophosphoesterase family protein [Deltaproteobacteria bacterium]
MKIAHLTDLHWMTPPSPTRLVGKRLLGSANLYLRGRRRHFQREVQRAAVERVVALAPDMVVISGDLTAQALPEEFRLARGCLDPILSRFPTLLVPGNHDVYTRGAAREDRIRELFAPWLGEGPLGRLDLGRVTCLGLDANRPGLFASGLLPQAQLDALGTTLSDPSLADRHLLIAIHHPVIDPAGGLYQKRSHGLLNADALTDLIDQQRSLPEAILSGHVHRAYCATHTLPSGRRLLQLDAGAGGYAPHGDRTGTFNLYQLDERGLSVATQQRYSEGAYREGPTVWARRP